MPAHIHAELMAQYAQDAMETDRPWERWEIKTCENGDWYTPESEIAFHAYSKYRRKPRTININGYEVPEPVRTALGEGTTYWVARIEYAFLYDYDTWRGCEFDYRWLKRGLVHLTEEAAIAHAKALLSFTAKPEVGDE